MSNSLVFARARDSSLSLRRLSGSVILSQGSVRRAIAFASSAVGPLAMAPFNIFPVLAVPMVISVWLIDGRRRRGLSCARTPHLDAHGRAPRMLARLRLLRRGPLVGSGCVPRGSGSLWLGPPACVLGIRAMLALFTAFGFAVARLLCLPSAHGW